MVLEGIAAADVTVSRTGEDVVLTIVALTAGGAAERITLKNNLADRYDRGIDAIALADGTTWTLADLRRFLEETWGTEGADTLVGSSVADRLIGLGGADTLKGGGGNDTYLWTPGDGNDTITEDGTASAEDRLILDGIAVGEVTVGRSGDDVTLTIGASAAGGTVERIVLKNNLADLLDRGVETIALADGTTWTRADLRRFVEETRGTAGSDNLVGASVADTLSGLGGADTLTGNAGNDTLIGGTGDDTLVGGTGNDTYRFDRGDGRDVVDNRGQSSADDRILFGGGIGFDQLWLEQATNDLKISVLGSDDAVRVKDWYKSSANRLDIATADGWTLADTAVNQLVQAMAAFGATPATPYGTTTLPDATREALEPILAASWQRQATL